MDTWNPPVLSTFSSLHRSIIFDYRGTGYSSISESPVTIALLADDIYRLMTELGIEKSAIVGFSMGASVAQEFCLLHPEKVDHLVLIAGTCGGPQSVPIDSETWKKLLDKTGSIDEIAARMFPLLFPDAWFERHDPWKFCPDVYETTTQQGIEQQAQAFISWQGCCDRLNGIKSPALIITGSMDRIISPRNSGVLKEKIPGSRLVVFPGAGHGLMYQCPDAFSSTVLSFIDGNNFTPGVLGLSQE